MEKRALLAIVLSILVLLVWQQLFVLPQQKKLEEERARQEESARQQQESGETGLVPEQGTPTPPPMTPTTLPTTTLSQRQLSGEAQQVTIDTPLLHVVLTTQGARISSWQLQQHKDTNGNRIELVSDDARQLSQFPLEVFTGDTALDEELNLGIYDANRQAVTLGEGDDPETVRLSYISRSGTAFTKELTFSPDSYNIDIVLRLADQAYIGKPLSVFWGPGLSSNLETFGRFDNPGVVTKTAAAKPTREQAKKISGLVTHTNVEWGAFDLKYFAAAFFPSMQSNTFMSHTIPLQAEEGEKIDPVRQIIIGLTQPLSPEEQVQLSLYAGPKERSELAKTYPGFDALIDYGFWGFIAKPLAIFMTYIYKYVNNYGIAIICLTILIKILFYPLTHKSFTSMKKMQELQPKMKVLQEKYKKDREQLNKEMMALYKQEGVNPMGGCFPMLLQLPVFFALYRTLSQSIELRGASFLWVKDLSAPETFFNITWLKPLVLMMGASMLLQQSMTPTTADNKQAQMFKFMPILFTAMFWNFPSGLVLYWFMNNILTIIQQYFINKGGDTLFKKSGQDDEQASSPARKRRKKGK